MIDLHTHSTASDGSLSPTELVRLAARSGLRALALTDHDSVAGIPEAEAEAAVLGLRLIRGVEIEIAFEPGEFHLLGLDLARIDGELGEALAGLARARKERNERIARRLSEAGMPVAMEELEALAGPEGQVGRPHIAALLAARKVVRTRQEAFDRFLGKGKPFYEPKACLELAEAMRLVREAGGLVVVAHPYSLFVSSSRRLALLDEWKELGVDGIEAFHPTAKLGQCRKLEAQARARGFRITAGSDFHGEIRPERKLGRTAGKLPIGDAYLEEIAR